MIRGRLICFETAPELIKDLTLRLFLLFALRSSGTFRTFPDLGFGVLDEACDDQDHYDSYRKSSDDGYRLKVSHCSF